MSLRKQGFPLKSAPFAGRPDFVLAQINGPDYHILGPLLDNASPILTKPGHRGEVVLRLNADITSTPLFWWNHWTNAWESQALQVRPHIYTFSYSIFAFDPFDFETWNWTNQWFVILLNGRRTLFWGWNGSPGVPDAATLALVRSQIIFDDLIRFTPFPYIPSPPHLLVNNFGTDIVVSGRTADTSDYPPFEGGDIWVKGNLEESFLCDIVFPYDSVQALGPEFPLGYRSGYLYPGSVLPFGAWEDAGDFFRIWNVFGMGDESSVAKGVAAAVNFSAPRIEGTVDDMNNQILITDHSNALGGVLGFGSGWSGVGSQVATFQSGIPYL